jgi:hypothetical protein
MPAIYDDNNGTMHVYTGTNAPGFKKAVSVARNANSALSSGHGNDTAVQNDRAAVGAIVERLYQIALTSGDPTNAVAALDRQYNNYFQNNGFATLVYKGEVATAKINANDSVATTNNIVAELRSKFGNGNNGVYTAAQITAAAKALDQNDPSDARHLRPLRSGDGDRIAG